MGTVGLGFLVPCILLGMQVVTLATALVATGFVLLVSPVPPYRCRSDVAASRIRARWETRERTQLGSGLRTCHYYFRGSDTRGRCVTALGLLRYCLGACSPSERRFEGGLVGRIYLQFSRPFSSPFRYPVSPLYFLAPIHRMCPRHSAPEPLSPPSCPSSPLTLTQV